MPSGRAGHRGSPQRGTQRARFEREARSRILRLSRDACSSSHRSRRRRLSSPVFVAYERPGLGIGHFYYLAIALAAMAGGAAVGAIAGTVATTLYVAGVIVNDHVPSDELVTTGTVTRGPTCVTIGALIGWFASRNRSMVDELRVLAERERPHGPAEHARVRGRHHEATRQRSPLFPSDRRHGRAQGLQPRRGLRRGQ
jgi:hypothetical protein